MNHLEKLEILEIAVPGAVSYEIMPKGNIRNRDLQLGNQNQLKDFIASKGLMRCPFLGILDECLMNEVKIAIDSAWTKFQEQAEKETIALPTDFQEAV